jgi:hypothetical protein
MHLNNSRLGPSLERYISFVIDSNEILMNAKDICSPLGEHLGKKYFETHTVACEDEM